MSNKNGPPACGAVLPERTHMVAYYTRPSTTARYFGLRAACYNDWEAILAGGLPDYMHGLALEELRCGDWVSYENLPESEAGSTLSGVGFRKAEAPPECGEER